MEAGVDQQQYRGAGVLLLRISEAPHTGHILVLLKMDLPESQGGRGALRTPCLLSLSSVFTAHRGLRKKLWELFASNFSH